MLGYQPVSSAFHLSSQPGTTQVSSAKCAFFFIWDQLGNEAERSEASLFETNRPPQKYKSVRTNRGCLLATLPQSFGW
jgi:hypothetical protein